MVHPELFRNSLLSLCTRNSSKFLRTPSTSSFRSIFQIETIRRPKTTTAHNVSSVYNSKLVLDKKYHGIETNIWVEFMALAAKVNPVNLAIGFPDYMPAQNMLYELAKTCTFDTHPSIHQYARGYGHPRLVNALASLYSQLLGRDINPISEVLITTGGYGALHNALSAFVGQGDEVIIIEPFFDRYEPLVTLAGGKPVYIALKPTSDMNNTSANWKLDLEELDSLFNENTKAIILNNPNNPLGKVFTREELEGIGDLCKKHNVLVISDEVYEWLVFDGREHVRIAQLDGMWDRTVTIGSAGKMFSLTGWRLGWAYGPHELIRNLQVAHHNTIHTCTTPLQEALGAAVELEVGRLGTPESIFEKMPAELAAHRDFMINFLRDVGMTPIIPEGGCFIMSNWRSIEPLLDLSSEMDATADYRLVKWLAKSWKVLGIPATPFYSEKNHHIAENLIRFCFFKKMETLRSAELIFKNLKYALDKNEQAAIVGSRS